MPSLGRKIELCIRRVGGHAGGLDVIFVSLPVFLAFFFLVQDEFCYKLFISLLQQCTHQYSVCLQAGICIDGLFDFMNSDKKMIHALT